MLPAFGLPIEGFPQFNVFWLLLASLVLVLLLPRWGVLLHLALLAVSMALDQTRLQPQCISMALLMVASLPSPGAKLIGRSHLIAIWFFAGLHKLLSAGYYSNVVPFLAVGLFNKDNALLFSVLGGALAAAEIAMGLLTIFPSTRRIAAVLAASVHITTLLWLWLHLGWNKSVWPWNIALIAAALLLIWPWQTTFPDAWRQSSRLAKLVVLVILISPVGVYFGVVDCLLGHCLYSEDEPRAKIVLPDGTEIRLDTVATSLNAPLPPAMRLFEAYFEQVGEPGEVMVIHDPRWWACLRGEEYREIYKPPRPR